MFSARPWCAGTPAGRFLCFHRPSLSLGSLGVGGGNRSVFTHRQQVVTCPKALQASEQQSRGSNPEP